MTTDFSAVLRDFNQRAEALGLQTLSFGNGWQDGTFIILNVLLVEISRLEAAIERQKEKE